ncbi:MAG: O-antigen ligase family protein [Verrucomicrobiales bacterium]|nr:O-antigen ligase family protein [Verrucomicrobiales bacterium]
MADTWTEGLLIALVIFTPWAFGTTQSWSLVTANTLGYLIGALLIVKWVLRRIYEFQPARWGENLVIAEDSGEPQPPERKPEPFVIALAIVTALMLAYILVSALNARAVYDPATRQFEYFAEPFRWLPYTYDRAATWQVFWQYLALACVFWATRDWLLHRTDRDDNPSTTPRWHDPHALIPVPSRLRRLLWILCLNGALLAMVSILQRADGTNKLLWLIESKSRKAADNVFGPWAYRANAAQYFNLLWPVCLAFWLWLQERAGRSALRKLGRFDGPHLMLLPCAIFMAACPIISGSRGGAMISVAAGAAAVGMILVLSRREIDATARWITAGGIVLAGIAAAIGGWNILRDRLSRPEMRVATGINIRTNDFTLLLRLQLPEHHNGRWQRLVDLCGDSRMANLDFSFTLGITPDGGILGQCTSTAVTNYNRVIATNVMRTFAGKEITLAAVRHNGLRLYANGQPLGAVEGRGGRAPGWASFVFSRYLSISSDLVGEIAVVDYAMAPDQVKAASSGRLAGLTESVQTSTKVVSVPLAAKALKAVDGVAVEDTTRPANPTLMWIAARRTGPPGRIGWEHSIQEDSDASVRGPIRVSFAAWNPGDSPIHLAISLDDGPRGVVEVPARGEKAIGITCRTSHGGPPARFSIDLVDDEGEWIEEARTGAQFLIRDLRLQPAATITTRSIDREVRLLDLTDRMSGRNEIYENAMEMLQQYPIWGSGAGTFASMYQFHRKPWQDWAGYLHNDWMEMRITLGPIGLGLIVVGLVLLLLRSLLGPGLATMRLMIGLWWIALLGCLAHARFDFPFQIYSVLFLFVLLSSVLLVLTAARWR